MKSFTYTSEVNCEVHTSYVPMKEVGKLTSVYEMRVKYFKISPNTVILKQINLSICEKKTCDHPCGVWNRKV